MNYWTPPVVTLPTATMIEIDHLRLAIGQPSRQLVSYWRKECAFPAPIRDGWRSLVVTDHVVDWLKGRGVEVQRL